MRAKQIEVDGRTWRYRVAGEGAGAMLVLPGALGSGDLMADYISSLLPGVRILVPEYAPAKTVEEFLNAFQAMLAQEKLNVDVVYGGSFGGLLAQCWARKYSLRTLILSGAGFPDPRRVSTNKRMVRLLPFIPIFLVRGLMKFAARMITKRMLQNSAQWRAELKTLASKITCEDLESRYRTAIDFDSNYRFSPGEIDPSRASVLLIEGTGDRVANKSIRQGMRELYPRASVVTIEGGGHSTMLTHPQEWAAAVSPELKST